MQKETKICPHCKSEIHTEATKCPQCRSIVKSALNKRTGCGIIVIFFVLFIVIILSLGGSENNNGSKLENNLIQAPINICSSFKESNTKTISFKTLNKDPNSFNGTITKFTGQIIQIQELNGSGIIRLAVIKESYGWNLNDIIYVHYTKHNNFVEGDVVTIYGIIQGVYTYTSQANYQITLPSMEGCLIK